MSEPPPQAPPNPKASRPVTGAERRKNTWTLIAILMASALPIVYTLYYPLKPKPPRGQEAIPSPTPTLAPD